LGTEVAAALQRLFPGKPDLDKCRYLIGNREAIQEIKSGRDASIVWSQAQEQAKQFEERRKPYLLY
jgi:uncharacterized protein YbbC (DUF1343 family)